MIKMYISIVMNAVAEWINEMTQCTDFVLRKKYQQKIALNWLNLNKYFAWSTSYIMMKSRIYNVYLLVHFENRTN